MNRNSARYPIRRSASVASSMSMPAGVPSGPIWLYGGYVSTPTTSVGSASSAVLSCAVFS